MKKNIKALSLMALLIAINIVLTRVLVLDFKIIKIDLGFLAIAICGMLFGPIQAAIVGGIAEFLGANLFPKGAYFLGFTLNFILMGIIYGVLLHKNYDAKKLLFKVILATLLIEIFVNFGLGTLWLSMIYTNTNLFSLNMTTINKFISLMPFRLIKLVSLVALNIAILPYFLPIIKKAYEKNI